MKKFILVSAAFLCAALILFTAYLHNKKEEIIVESLIAIRTESELILDSDVIILGTVSEILDSKWSNENLERGDEIPNLLQTDIIVNVDDILYGECGDSVTVRIDKGETDDTIVYNDAYPDFFEDEKVLLFLSRDDGVMNTGEDYYLLTGLRQGKYILEQSSTRNSTTESEVYENQSIQNGEKIEFDISSLKDRIITENESNPNYKEEKAIRQAEIIEENKKLFGE